MHYGSEGDETNECQRNNILHRAILLYMGQELDLRYSKAQVLLSAVKEEGTIDNDVDRYSGRNKKVYGGTAEQLKAYSINVTPPKGDWVPLGDDVFFFQSHKQTTSDDPSKGGSRGIVKTVRALGSRGIVKTVTFIFASHKSDGDLRIQAFLNKAFLWYCKAMESTEDHFRYYYTPLTEANGRAQVSRMSQGEMTSARALAMGNRCGMGNASGSHAVQRYKRYRLGNDKAFDTLFFPEKELLLKILHNFQHKTGKYGIKGYPHKLGLLLHGPPGTGKSSLIKALALHTERHIIDVPLARIKTNQDLMDIMFDQSFPVDKQGLPVTLAVENVIFVMEDVDATSPIVRSRELDDNNGWKPAEPENKQARAKKPVARGQAATAEREAAVAAVAGNVVRPAVTSDIDVSAATTATTATTAAATTASPSAGQGDGTPGQLVGVVKPGGVSGLPGASVAEGAGREGKSAEGGEAEKNKDDGAGGKEENMKGRSPATQSPSAVEVALLQLTEDARKKNKKEEQEEKENSSMEDKLDLAGLLNVLDGVVDSPGRIVIMTTNFPDALDAALIRPGRIDKKIHLGYMKYEAAKEMTRHFFEVDQLTVNQDQRLRMIFDEDRPSHGDGVEDQREGAKAARRQLTPAVVEQLAGEFDYVDEFIGALEAI